jgi:hypothetical protein
MEKTPASGIRQRANERFDIRRSIKSTRRYGLPQFRMMVAGVAEFSASRKYWRVCRLDCSEGNHFSRCLVPVFHFDRALGSTRGAARAPLEIFEMKNMKSAAYRRSSRILNKPVQLPAQLGNGLRDDKRKALMRSRIEERR